MSSIGAVKTRLVEILAAALPDTQVIPGPVDVTTLSSRALEVGDASTPIQFDITSLDGSTGSEQYTLTLTVSVSLPGTEIATAEDIALADFVAAVAAIQTDPSLGIENLSSFVSGGGELVEAADSRGRSAAVRFPVEVFTTF